MASRILHGIPVSAGVSIGKAFFLDRGRRSPSRPQHLSGSQSKEQEIERLQDAFSKEQANLAEARDKAPPELKDLASIIDTHLMISKDPRLLLKAVQTIRDEAVTAEWAVDRAVRDLADAFERIDNPYIRERIQDVRQVADRILSRLAGGVRDKKLSDINERVVLMAHDLSPADTIGLDVSKIMSFATTLGGKTSHTGILARSLQIPALVGVEDLEDVVVDKQLVILDGLKGKLFIDPDEAELAYYSDLKYQFEAYHCSIMRECAWPGETIDGYRIQVLSNIELFEEVSAVLDNGGEGVGLYRTEYSYLNRPRLPEEEELVEEYSDLAGIMSPRRVVFRTLDVGADKLGQAIPTLEEPNPSLGLRAVRFCLKHEDIFRRQLRAILRASVHGDVALMFPLISGLRELQQAKHCLGRAQRELKAEGLKYNPEMPIGIMVELPSAVMIAEILAQEVDFFSIGTNDLIQYSLGIDRTNQHVSYLYQPLHPAVLRSVKHVVDMGHEAGIEVGVCGELASDPYCVPILLGMQVDNISITPNAIPGIKRVIRQTTMEECKRLLNEILKCQTVSKINSLVRKSIFRRFPEELMFFSSLLDVDEG